MRNTDERQCQPVITSLIHTRHTELFRVCPVEFITGFFISGFSLMAEGRRRLPILVDQLTVSVTPSS